MEAINTHQVTRHTTKYKGFRGRERDRSSGKWLGKKRNVIQKRKEDKKTVHGWRILNTQ